MEGASWRGSEKERLNSDTATTQWGQDEEVLLIEPDRGEDREKSPERLRGGESHMTERGRRGRRRESHAILFFLLLGHAWLKVE